MAICGVVASESLLTYDPVRSGGIPRSALHLTIPEQAPTPKYSGTLRGRRRARFSSWAAPAPVGFLTSFLGIRYSHDVMTYRSAFVVLVCAVWVVAAGPASASQPLKIRVAHLPNVTHAQALIAHGTGRFAQAMGPDVAIDWKVFNAGPTAVQALFAGEIDLAYLGTGPAIVGYVKSRGQALRVIAGAADGGAALVVRPQAGIHGAADFRGKRVASPQLGNTQDVALRGWL